MNIPCYKFVRLAGATQEQVFSVLRNVSFKEAPVVIQVEHLDSDQITALKNIELFYNNYSLGKLPYGLYILSSEKKYDGHLTVINSQKKLPDFYKHKNRALNSKENLLMNKVNLKRTNLANIRPDEYELTLKIYANGQKALYYLNSEYEYLKKIQDKIK
ncbi:MAG: hypothetical protein QF441_07480 [Bacteriovoracaceae bacterium]|jgi:hypothetical protein|nr:hypothetical protein [Bacteriovoracaceae bacterium]